MNDKVFCPLVDKNIDIVECMENREIKEGYIPEEFKKKENWKDICNGCKYHGF